MKSTNNAMLDSAIKSFLEGSTAAQQSVTMSRIAMGALQIATAIKGEASDKFGQGLADAAFVNLYRLNKGMTIASPNSSELRTLALALQQIAGALKSLSG